MGGTWGTEKELEVIADGTIWYKKADIHETNVELFGNDMAIVWNHITMLSEVNGNEVTNPFMVTEVYHKDNEQWKLVNLTFSKLLN
ncbi:MAG: nuclear transport factor 2 family protein [Flavobacteriaceae bacterium]